MALRLILLRHTETVATMQGRCYGLLDIALSPEGVLHAELVAECLRHEEIDVVYSSPLQRARSSAEPLARALHKDVLVEDDLREVSFGRCEGLTFLEIEHQFPEVYREWMASPGTVVFPEGESLNLVQQRVGTLLVALQDRHPRGTIALYSHAGVGRALLAHMLDMSPDAAFRLSQDFGAVNVVDIVENVPILRVMNLRLTPTDSALPPAIRHYEPVRDKETS